MLLLLQEPALPFPGHPWFWQGSSFAAVVTSTVPHVRSDVTDLLTPVCFFLQAPIQRRKKPASQKKRRFKTHNDHLVGVLKDYSDVVPGKQWAVEFWSKRAFLDGLSAAGARCLLAEGLTVYNNVMCFPHPSNCRGETGQFKSKYELLNVEVNLIS